MKTYSTAWVWHVDDPLIKTNGESEIIENGVRAGRIGEWKRMDGRRCPFSLCVFGGKTQMKDDEWLSSLQWLSPWSTTTAAAAAELKADLLAKTSSSYQFMCIFASCVTSEAEMNSRSLECASMYLYGSDEMKMFLHF